MITSSLFKKLVEDTRKNNAANKKEFQSRFQKKTVKNVSGTERKLVYRHKNKSRVDDRTKAELVKCKISKSQTRKRQILLRIISSADSEGSAAPSAKFWYMNIAQMLKEPLYVSVGLQSSRKLYDALKLSVKSL